MIPFISQWVRQSITSQTSPFVVSTPERSWSLLHESVHYHQKNPNKKPSTSPPKTPYTINKYIGLPTHKPLRTPLAADHRPYMKSHCFQNCNVVQILQYVHPTLTFLSQTAFILMWFWATWANINKKQDFQNYKAEKEPRPVTLLQTSFIIKLLQKKSSKLEFAT